MDPSNETEQQAVAVPAETKLAVGAIRAPKPFTMGSNFELWLKRWQTYAKCVRIPEDSKAGALVLSLDDNAFQAIDQLGLDIEKDSYDEVKAKLLNHFASKATEPELRFKLNQRKQEPGETLETFAGILLDLAKRGHRGLEPKHQDELARDQFIAGIQDEKTQERLLVDSPSSLDDAVKLARRLTAVHKTQQKMREGTRAKVHAVGDQRSIIGDDTSSARVHAVGDQRSIIGDDSSSARVHAVGDRQTSIDDRFEAVKKGNTSEMAAALRANTEVLTRLVEKTQRTDTPTPTETGRQRGRRSNPITCWSCGQLGHMRNSCPEWNSNITQDRPSGNESQLPPRTGRQRYNH